MITDRDPTRESPKNQTPWRLVAPRVVLALQAENTFPLCRIDSPNALPTRFWVLVDVNWGVSRFLKRTQAAAATWRRAH